MRFIVADNREIVVLVASQATKAGGSIAVTGKFKTKGRMIELSDAQAALFQEPLETACAKGKGRVLYAPAGWPPPAHTEPEAEKE